MLKYIKDIQRSLISKLILILGFTLLIIISTWAYFNINYQKNKFMEYMVTDIDRLSNTIKLGTHYAMMINSKSDINQIIKNISRQKEIENIRIYNKSGIIKFSNNPFEVDMSTNIKAEACNICHDTSPPLSNLTLDKRTRIFDSQKGYRLLGIICPIYNEPGCSSLCHFHPNDKKILGAIDVVVSLEKTDAEIKNFEKRIIQLASVVFLLTSFIIFIFLQKFLNNPIKKLIKGTSSIAKGDVKTQVEIAHNDEIGQLAMAINKMSQEIGEKTDELNKQKDEYQNLFELVPCIITVVDKNYKIIKYNHEYRDKFDPMPDAYCYNTYKGLDRICDNCPVKKTFEDGMPHFTEEIVHGKGKELSYWIVRTSPIKDSKGNIIAALEMSLDITKRKKLEDQLKLSEKKYQAIFNNIPNPVFVLDIDSLEIIDCNERVKTVYGYDKDELKHTNFMNLFANDEKENHVANISLENVINKVRHINKQGNAIFVDIWISPSEYADKQVLLVSTSDITKRLEAEQQLIQASKLATLGEMATGIAHELNQPLSVIKTASSFCIKKTEQNKKIEEDILFNLLHKIDNNVDRATKIINHMRQFAYKSEKCHEMININEVLDNAFEIFSQQLKIKGIYVEKEFEKNIPDIMANPGRMEQVFINLLINARDAIEERWGSKDYIDGDKKITLSTRAYDNKVEIKVADTGNGIPKKIADKIFEPFFTTKEVGKGTGLGLSISYGIIKDYGGEIRIDKTCEQGACFIIEFPSEGWSNK